MLELSLTPQEKLISMVKWTSQSAVSREMEIDRSNIRGMLSGERGIGVSTRKRIDEAYSKSLKTQYGTPALRFLSPFGEWLEEIREMSQLDAEERKPALRNLYFRDKLSVLAHEAFTHPGSDQNTTVRRAMMNLVGASINWRAVPVLLNAVEQHARSQAPTKAVEQYGAAADLLRHAKDYQGGADTPWSDQELKALIGYSRFNQLAVLSEFRHERRVMNGGFSVFSVEAVERYLQPALKDVGNVLQLYPAGHPNRLTVAANTLVVGSLAKDDFLVREAWSAMAAEEPRAADLRFKLPTHDRPLAESSQTLWVREHHGFVLNPIQ